MAGVSVTAAGGYAYGLVAQAVVAAGNVLGIPYVANGEVYEASDAAQAAGANAADRLLQALGLRPAPANTASAGALLGTARLSVSPGASPRLAVDVRAAATDWRDRGNESSTIAVYVDGRYHSDLIVLAERPGRYDINLAGLAPGDHRIELRAAPDRSSPNAGVPQVVSLSPSVVRGDQALIDRHAPIVVLRDAGGGRQAPASHTDTPLLMLPLVRRLRDGGRIIEYRILFSNEDGGTKLPDLFSRWGRGVDIETVYRVRLDARGRVVDERYQAALHEERPFQGERIDGRPVLRLATLNNMFSQRTSGAGQRWSEAPRAPVSAATTDIELMSGHPWTFAVMGKELLREGRPAAATGNGDPRRFLFVSNIPAGVADAMRGGAVLMLRLAGGRRVPVSVRTNPLNGSTAVMLPAAVRPDAVVGVEGLTGRAWVLDARFQPRELATTRRRRA